MEREDQGVLFGEEPLITLGVAEVGVDGIRDPAGEKLRIIVADALVEQRQNALLVNGVRRARPALKFRQVGRREPEARVRGDGLRNRRGGVERGGLGDGVRWHGERRRRTERVRDRRVAAPLLEPLAGRRGAGGDGHRGAWREAAAAGAVDDRDQVGRGRRGRRRRAAATGGTAGRAATGAGRRGAVDVLILGDAGRCRSGVGHGKREFIVAAGGGRAAENAARSERHPRCDRAGADGPVPGRASGR